jgi:hypothetical protein
MAHNVIRWLSGDYHRLGAWGKLALGVCLFFGYLLLVLVTSSSRLLGIFTTTSCSVSLPFGLFGFVPLRERYLPPKVYTLKMPRRLSLLSS